MARKRRPPRPGSLTDLAPLPILRKILLLQAAWYASATILILFSALVAGHRPISLNLILDWHTVRADTTIGWMIGMCWCLNGLISVIWILILVVRSKLVLDFALTTQILHLVCTSLYTRAVPRQLFWWTVNAMAVAVMSALGIWACRWRELKPISFGSLTGTTPATNAASLHPDVEDGQHANGPAGEGVGFMQGRREGGPGGAYEMVDRSDRV
jgi:protein SYS1